MNIPATQEPKYDVTEAGFVNRASNEVIPHDEPVFILRARDVHAINVLAWYAGLVKDDNHRLAVLKRVGHFQQFAMQFPERMKEPDTEAAKDL